MYQKIVCSKVSTFLVRSAHGQGKGRTEALEGGGSCAAGLPLRGVVVQSYPTAHTPYGGGGEKQLFCHHNLLKSSYKL